MTTAIDISTPELEALSRESVIAEARSWIGTPYHDSGAMVKQAGCDCASFLYCVYHTMGFIPDEEIGVFSQDWFKHTTEEVYMRRVLRHAYKIVEKIAHASMEAKPGNIVLVKGPDSKIFNHGGVVTKWPRVIAAAHPRVAEVNATKDELWTYKLVMVFDPWEKLKAENK